MKKFMDLAKFWATVNQWIREGSNIYDVLSFNYGDVIIAFLVSKNGAKEELHYYMNEADYDAAASYIVEGE